MRYELKAVGIWSFIKVLFFFNLIVGFLGGVLAALFFGMIMAVAGGVSGYQRDMFGPAAPSGAFLIALPFFYAIGGAVFGTIFGAVGAGVYNLLARFLGGLELTLEKAELAPVPPQQPAPRPSPAPPPPPRPGPPSEPIVAPPPGTPSPPTEPIRPRPPSDNDPQQTQPGDNFPRQ
jgi:hypothetical protein